MMGRLERAAEGVARVMALAGGLVLVLLVAMTSVSIAGRAAVPLGLGPVRGDFEMIEIGVGFAIFAFLPWCQLHRAHAVVDLLKPALPRLVNRALDVAADLLMLAAAGVLAWRLWLGTLDKHRYGETTFILEAPVWMGYAAALVGALAFVFVAAVAALRGVLGGGRDV